MIIFEQAKDLKKGDVVFEGEFECFVVKTKVDNKAKTVAITYTDGGADNFEGSNKGLSLTREGETAPAKDAGKATAPKKSKPESSPVPKATGDIMIRLKAGVGRNAEWSSLDWFEQDRKKIAQDISSALDIPIDEFADTPETACFHFMTLSLAIAKWLFKSGSAEFNMRDERDMNQFEELARSKVMAGILVRLFGHPYVQNIGEMEGLGAMVQAFTKSTGVQESMFGHILTAHTYVRQSTLLMARHLADGSEGDSPVKVEFFDAYNEFLENDHDEFMPSDAVMDASIQLYSTIKFINEQAALPVSLDGLPEEDAESHQFLRNYLMLAGMYRTPATLQLEKLSFEGASLDAAIESLADEKPLVLIDPIFRDGDDTLEIVVPINPLTRHSDSQSLAGHIAKVAETLPTMPAISIAMYPMA